MEFCISMRRKKRVGFWFWIVFAVSFGMISLLLEGRVLAQTSVEERLSSEEMESQLSLSHSERREVEQILWELGHLGPRLQDGWFDEATREALRSWQEAKGEEETGYLTSDQVEILLQEGGGEAGLAERDLNLAQEEWVFVLMGLIIHLGEDFSLTLEELFQDRRQMRETLRDWQESRGEIPTGYLTVGQYYELSEVGKEREAEFQGVDGGLPLTVKEASWPEEAQQGFEPVTFIRVPAGIFLMGSPVSEANRGPNEGPQHLVTLTRSFEIQRTEVTQWHWVVVMGYNPSSFTSPSHCPGEHRSFEGTALCPNHPVERVSWDDIQVFLTRLNERVGEEEGYLYRLPTEAEWEYAARAGNSTAYSFGNDAGELDQYGWHILNSGKQTHAVASLKPNPWGLHDVHGNVYEWVQDLAYRTYTSSPVTDPLHTSGSNRVLRGGWITSAQYLRSAFRYYRSPGDRHSAYGFRLVRTKN